MTGESALRISEMRTSMLVEISLEACISLLSCHGTEAVENAFVRLRKDQAVLPKVVDAEVRLCAIQGLGTRKSNPENGKIW